MFHHEIIEKKRVYIFSAIPEPKLVKNDNVGTRLKGKTENSGTSTLTSISLLFTSILLLL